MKVNIVKKSETKPPDPEYRRMVIDEFRRLNCFSVWETFTHDSLIIKNSHANSDMFVVAGIVQYLLKGLGFFHANTRDNAALCFELDNSASWKDVYSILKDIDRIEITE